MKRFFFISLGILFFQSAQSQELMRVFEDTVNENSMLRISSFNYYSSNRLNNAFMDKFLFGGYIDTELKENNLNRLRSLNSLGAEAEQRIDSYTPTINPFKKERYGLMLSFSDQHFLSSNFSTDLFKLSMYGNQNFLGDTFDLSYNHARYQHYQKLSFGIYDEHTMSSVQISYVAGSKGFDLFSGNSFFWTHSEVDSVELQLRGQGFATDTLKPYWAFQGAGFSVDINYNFIFNSKKGDRQVIALRIANLGGIFWNKNTNNYRVDSTTYYTGFNVNDLIQQDSMADAYNFIDTLGVIKTKSRFGESLPMEISIDKLADRNGKKVQSIFGFKAIMTPDYRPYLYGGIYYQPNYKFSASTYFSYGGFAGFRWGMYFNYWPSDKIYIALGTVDLVGNISKKFGFGRSAVLSASFKL